MSRLKETNASPANRLCKACGLCCTGHLFIWTKLRSAELDSAEAIGLNVIRAVPSQRGFNQPCPLWQGQCTIYTTSSYPHFCRTYKCALLKKVLDESIPLTEALSRIKQVKGVIRELEALLPDSPNPNFRERLAAQLEALETFEEPTGQEGWEFRRKAGELLALYEQVFGVDDVIERSMEE